MHKENSEPINDRCIDIIKTWGETYYIGDSQKQPVSFNAVERHN